MTYVNVPLVVCGAIALIVLWSVRRFFAIVDSNRDLFDSDRQTTAEADWVDLLIAHGAASDFQHHEGASK